MTLSDISIPLQLHKAPCISNASIRANKWRWIHGLNLSLRSGHLQWVRNGYRTLSITHILKQKLDESSEEPAAAFGLTFCMMWLTQGDVQLLRSGPWGSQKPKWATHTYVATPARQAKQTGLDRADIHQETPRLLKCPGFTEQFLSVYESEEGSGSVTVNFVMGANWIKTGGNEVRVCVGVRCPWISHLFSFSFNFNHLIAESSYFSWGAQ